MSYGKIFETVFTGTLFGSGPTVFAVWAYVIATAKPPGTVELNPKLLAACIGTDISDVKRAIEVLCAPDPDSRNPDQEGRRLVLLEGMQYQVVSFQKYRDMRDSEQRREYMRELMRKRRSANTANTVLTSANSELTPDNKANGLAKLAKAEAEAEVNTSPPKSPASGGRRGRQLSGGLFDRFWSAYPRKASRGQAERAFAAISPDEQLVARMCAGIERARTSDQWQRDGGQFIPYPATWLRARGWEDEAPPTAGQIPDWMARAI